MEEILIAHATKAKQALIVRMLAKQLLTSTAVA
jgi:hypothetical protein